jgi:UTP-glucose-1-phosphate uridylyltransferase
LGHATWCARAFVGDDPFAILLPDDLIPADKSCLVQLAEAHYETGGNGVALTEVPREQTNRYGVLKIGRDDGRLVGVTGLVEKPARENAPSDLSIVGRYILLPEVIEYLAHAAGSGQRSATHRRFAGANDQPDHNRIDLRRQRFPPRPGALAVEVLRRDAGRLLPAAGQHQV